MQSHCTPSKNNNKKSYSNPRIYTGNYRKLVIKVQGATLPTIGGDILKRYIFL